MKQDKFGQQAKDFNIHGLVSIRLENASAQDVAMVRSQLALEESLPSGTADILIRFVDKLPVHSPLNYIGLDDIGYTDQEFLMMRGWFQQRVLTWVDFEQIGEQCTILTEHGHSMVTSLLLPIVNLTLLKKGIAPLHACAFVYQGVGFLVTGWSRSGKTETLLSFMAQGAEYIGDEWIYIGRTGECMYGIPKPVNLWEWHLQELGEYAAAIRTEERMRLRFFGWVKAGMDWMLRRGIGQTPAMARMREWLYPEVERRLTTKLSPHKLFGKHVGRMQGSIDRLIFLSNHNDLEIQVRPMNPDEVVHRMVNSHQHDRQKFLAQYWKYKFAFPSRKNELIENYESVERKALLAALAGKETYGVFHPYPVAMKSLFQAIQPLCISPYSSGTLAEEGRP